MYSNKARVNEECNQMFKIEYCIQLSNYFVDKINYLISKICYCINSQILKPLKQKKKKKNRKLTLEISYT